MATATAKTVKVSSKRQITIPAEAYKRLGFKSYAYLEERDGGIFIRPVEVLDEREAVDILRYLVEEGYAGEELIRKFEEMQPDVIEVARDLDAAMEEYKRGEYLTMEDLRRHMREYKHQLEEEYGISLGSEAEISE